MELQLPWPRENSVRQRAHWIECHHLHHATVDLVRRK